MNFITYTRWFLFAIFIVQAVLMISAFMFPALRGTRSEFPNDLYLAIACALLAIAVRPNEP